MQLITSGCQDEDFIAEAETFGQLRHKNLVKLLGYWIKGTHRYQFLSFFRTIDHVSFVFLTSIL